MLAQRIFLMLLLASASTVGRSAVAEDWVGKKVMPKSDGIQLRNDGHTTGGVFNIQWPAVVKTIDGTWLWVEDDGGVSRVAGWVRDSDVVLFNKALNHFNSRLQAGSPAGGLYWLRGICWEAAQEFDMAAKDYQDAVRQRPSNPDALAGLARVTAKTKYDDQKFVAAWQLNKSLPRFFIDWGQALEAAKQPDRAKAMYAEAVRLNPNWHVPHYSLGKLLAGQGKHDDALPHFDEALRRDNTFYQAYRDRAAACLVCKKKTDANSAALTSARKACELCYFRDAESLAVLAQTLAAFEQWPDAARFQQMAVEYAPLSQKEKHRELWADYDAKQRVLEAQQVAALEPKPGPGERPKSYDPNDVPKRRLPPLFIDRSSRRFE